jgi:O-antigen/teichoic acid export membrane protein
MIIFYAYPLLLFWIGSDDVASNAYTPLILLTLANMANAISNIPYTLLVAQGQTHLLLLANLTSAMVYVPLSILLISTRGLPGGAFLFMLLNVALLLYYLLMVNRRVFHGFLSQILNGDVVLYVLLGLAFIGLPRIFTRDSHALFIMLLSGVVYFSVGIPLFSSRSSSPDDIIAERAE